MENNIFDENKKLLRQCTFAYGMVLHPTSPQAPRNESSSLCHAENFSGNIEKWDLKQWENKKVTYFVTFGLSVKYEKKGKNKRKTFLK